MSSHLPLDELQHVNVVVIEASPSMATDYEWKLSKLAHRIRQVGLEVAIICQTILRRDTQKATWVHKWNQMEIVCSPCSIRVRAS